MAVVGKNYAVLERGWLRTSGFLTWLVWAFVHILSLPQSAEPPARAAPVALVVFHRPAQLAPDPRAAANTGRGNEVSSARCGRSCGSV